jgi:alpha-beta hydrolase superfamily lysophospholipase
MPTRQVLSYVAVTNAIVVTLLFAGAAFAQPNSAQPPVTFQAPDGFILHADQYGSGNRGVILVHGGRFNKESWKKQAETLAENGFYALAIDFRGYGQTIAGTQTADWKHYPDVLAAVRYLRSHGATSVAIVGASMGGDAAGDAVVAAKPGEIDKIVLLAADGGNPPGRLTGDKLFILSRDDKSGDGPRLPGIFAAFQAAPDPKRLVILEGSAHAQFLFDTDQGPRLMEEILKFLKKE